MESPALNRRRAISSLVLVAALVAAVLAVPGTAVAAERQVTFDGAGWGHGVGMSQYGAQARALAGQTHEEILATYYQGTTLSTFGIDPLPDTGDIYVNVQSDTTTRTVSILDGPGVSTGGVVVTRGEESIELFAGDTFTIVDLTPALEGGCTVSFTAGPTEWLEGSCDVAVALTPASAGLPAHLVRLDSCRTSYCTFGWGSRLLMVDNGSPQRAIPDKVCPGTCPLYPGFDVVVEIGIDDYARGIAEVPFSWHLEALKTQAIAARSYAANLDVSTGHSEVGCFCDIRNHSADQVYGGWLGGSPLWEAWDLAADSTSGVVVSHPSSDGGGIVRAYYSSSNGGASESSEDKWGGALPYMVSVPDAFSLQPPNPNASWTVKRSVAEVAGWLGLSDVTDVAVLSRNDSGSPRRIEFIGLNSSGVSDSVEKWVWEVQSRFGLKSWYFDISVDPPPPPPGAHGAERVGLHDPTTGIWHLRNGDGSVSSFYYGNPKDIPYAGDWDGDGIVTLGLYRQSTGFLFLRNSNTEGIADIQIYYGNPGDVPIAGDWDGDGVDTVGIFRPSEARFYLRNTNTQGVGDVSFAFGEAGDVPLAGDWNGDGIDTVGIYRPSTKTLYLANSNTNPAADFTWVYAGVVNGDRVIAGDWNDDSIDTVGIFRPSTGTFYLRDTFSQSAANIVFEMGDSYMTPIAGWWGP